MSKRTLAVLTTLIVVAAGCAGSESADDALDDAATEPAATEPGDPADTEPSATEPSETTPADTTPADEGNAAVTTPAGSSEPAPSNPTALYAAGDIDKGLQPFIEQALVDLAKRLGVDAAAITTHAAVLVVWPDSSLGCPQPDMSYAQAQMDGSVIEFEHDGRYFRYHTGGSQGPFLCDTPITKTPPTEGLSISDSADS